MDEREFGEVLKRALQHDFSAGTEAFRDELLARCLAELNAEGRVIELGDGDLALLAAAGDHFGGDEDAASARFLDASGKGRAY